MILRESWECPHSNNGTISVQNPNLCLKHPCFYALHITETLTVLPSVGVLFHARYRCGFHLQTRFLELGDIQSIIINEVCAGVASLIYK